MVCLKNLKVMNLADNNISDKSMEYIAGAA